MIPTQGQYVKIIFRNGAQAEGYVESWSDGQSILKAKDSANLFLIQKTNEDVMAIKIIVDEPPNLTSLEQAFTKMEEEFQEVYQQPSSDELRIKNLAQLKAAMNEQERKIAAAKLKDHTFSGVRKTNYEHGFFKK